MFQFVLLIVVESTLFEVIFELKIGPFLSLFHTFPIELVYIQKLTTIRVSSKIKKYSGCSEEEPTEIFCVLVG